MSLSNTISAPIFLLASSVTAITTLYTVSFVLPSVVFVTPRNFFNFPDVPSCSKLRLNSGWKTTININAPVCHYCS